MKIIAPIDGTPSAEVLLDVLLGQRWQPGTEIKLLSVVKKGASKDLENDAAAMLQEKISVLQPKLKNCRILSEVAQGEAKAQIVDATKSWPADLVIMGTRGHKGLDLVLMGSVSQGVLMQSTSPVLIAKAKPDTEQELRKGFHNVIVAIDNSPFSRAAIDWVAKMSWPEDVRIRLVAAIQPLAELFAGEANANLIKGLTAEQAALFEAAKEELQIQSARLGLLVKNSSQITTQVGEGDAREFILNAAASFSADLIVVGSHGKTGLTKLLLGSVSQAVALHAPCSVAVVKSSLARTKNTSARQTGQFTKK